MSRSRTTSTVRRATPVLAAATVLVSLLGAAWVLNRSSPGDDPVGSGGKPPVLRLAEYQPAAASGPAQDGWALTGTLPAGPAEAATRTFRPASSDRVTALAQSLGFTRPGRQLGGATRFEEPDASLRVHEQAGGEWQFTRGDVSSSSGSVSSSRAGTGVALAGPTPSAKEALALAQPVLEAAGIDASTATVTGLGAGSSQVTVVAEPEVNGLTSYGVTTSVTVAAGEIAAAAGFLGDTEDGATYPLISAQLAWKQLLHTPMPQMLMACPEQLPETADPLSCGGPVTVTGAELGLSLQHEGSSPVLVPAWLFEVQGSLRLLPALAVDPSHLGSPLPTTGGGAPGSSGPGSSGPGSSAPGQPGGPGQPSAGVATPGPVSPEPVDPGSRFSAVPAGSGDALLVTFTGGVDACFDYRVVARETESSVQLSLVEQRAPGDKACIDLAQIYQRRVQLTRPLRDRAVIDAESGGRVQLGSP